MTPKFIPSDFRANEAKKIAGNITMGLLPRDLIVKIIAKSGIDVARALKIRPNRNLLANFLSLNGEFSPLDLAPTCIKHGYCCPYSTWRSTSPCIPGVSTDLGCQVYMKWTCGCEDWGSERDCEFTMQCHRFCQKDDEQCLWVDTQAVTPTRIGFNSSFTG